MEAGIQSPVSFFVMLKLKKRASDFSEALTCGKQDLQLVYIIRLSFHAAAWYTDPGD